MFEGELAGIVVGYPVGSFDLTGAVVPFELPSVALTGIAGREGYSGTLQESELAEGVPVAEFGPVAGTDALTLATLAVELGRACGDVGP